jgi:peptide/nickel transport system permease protein
MLTYITRRVLYSIPVVLVASFLLFAFVRATFDPTAHLRSSRTAASAIKEERKRLHLDEPVVVQYWDWLKKAVHGDFGTSERTGEDVFAMIRRSLWVTIQLIFWGILISAFVAISIGVYSAVRQYSALDYTFTGLSFVALAMPPFWFGLIAIQFLGADPKSWFHLQNPLLYSVGLHGGGVSGLNMDYVRHLILPVMTLTVQIVAGWSRYQRAAMLDVMSADYIRTARAKGVPRRRVIFKHGLRNALIPLVTVMALDIGVLFGGLIVTEFIFSIPGMGRLFYDSLLGGDATVLVAWTIVTATFIIAFNLLADVLYGWLDPRIRFS